MRFWRFEKGNLEEIVEKETTGEEKEDLDNLDSNNTDIENNTDTGQDSFSGDDSLENTDDNLNSNEENTTQESDEDDSSFDNGDELEKDLDETIESNDSSSSSTSGSDDSLSEENTLDEQGKQSGNSGNTDDSQENDSSDNSDELGTSSNDASQSNDDSSSDSSSSEDTSNEENTLDEQGEQSDNSGNVDDSQENDSSDNDNELGTSSNGPSESNDNSGSDSTSGSDDSSSDETTLDEQGEQSDNSGNADDGQESTFSDNNDELEKCSNETSDSSDTSNQDNSFDADEELDDESSIDNQNIKKDSQENGESIDERKEKLQELRDKLDEYSKKKLNLERESLKPGEDISEESSEKDDYRLSDQSNKFLEELSSLPSFKDRDRGDGYSIDTSKYSSIPDSLVRTLISKFLNQRFCKRDTDLNIRSNSFSKTHGFHKWEVKDMIVHLETEQLNKVLEDKYGYQYAAGASENVPLSFYFDMSGSMSEYTNMLAVIAIELLKKNVKVLIGFNERVNVQIDKIDKNITIDELVSVLESAGYSGYSYGNSDRFIRNSKVTYKFINRDIDDYLLSKECEKCVVFSDFDPLSEVIGLSQKAKVYWFCFEKYFTKYDLGRFKGFIYQTNSAEDIIKGLIKVNENRFETLCFVSHNKTLQRRK